MAKLLLVSDARTILDELSAALDDGEQEIRELYSGEAVRASVAADPPDIVVADCQIGNMGGIAVCLDLKLEESGGRLPYLPVLVLLDRRADVFLARRSGAEGWLVKPLDPLRLRRAAKALLDGGTYEDESYRPVPTLAGS
ncbi:MAG TPA: response regulator [Acidimicrobiales bacterium]|nr:response regulator [Acidimicrobiales bacterium]